ncbi:MAG: radical SAM protein [Acidobacteriota bacterium]|nr:radical SAM protein [Acidobacteriota bacterium]
MRFAELAFTVTEDCNFRCAYCYQRKTRRRLDAALAARAVEAFFPRLEPVCFVHFYGGEPLLAYDVIRDAVMRLRGLNARAKKEIHFTISTNAGLLTDAIMEFLAGNRFSVMLSFDGFAQEIHRAAGSFRRTDGALRGLLDVRGIGLETNSVFTSRTVGFLARSLEYFADIGVPDVSLSISDTLPWSRSSVLRLKKELASLRRYSLAAFEKTGRVPFVDFREKRGKGVFACLAGRKRISVAPDGSLWGCPLFYDRFKSRGRGRNPDYCLGTLDEFIERPARPCAGSGTAGYKHLRMEYFLTPDRLCLSCPDIADCAVCPVEAAFSSGIIGGISRATCLFRRLVRAEKKLFWDQVRRRGYAGEAAAGRGRPR